MHFLSTVFIFAHAAAVSALLSGSQKITPHNYVDMGPALDTNPPSCGMAYATLDIARITAVQAMNKATDCGKCLKVVNGADSTRYAYVLAVDTGGRGLDVSTVIYKEIFGQDTDPVEASWSQVDDELCMDIWRNASGSSHTDSQSDSGSQIQVQDKTAPSPSDTDDSQEESEPSDTTSAISTPTSSSLPSVSPTSSTSPPSQTIDITDQDKYSDLPSKYANVALTKETDLATLANDYKQPNANYVPTRPSLTDKSSSDPLQDGQSGSNSSVTALNSSLFTSVVACGLLLSWPTL
ncbi:hypothetical protein H4R33_006093 [Dimargaris cristalligena]|nr:hypothetical protein H4R33_006093 [Dimargaris cristalligena]